MTRTFSLFALLFLLAPAAAAAGVVEEVAPRKLVVLDLKPGAVDPATVATITSLVSVAAARAEGIEVLTSADLREMLDLEAQRQALGCDDESSCLSEIAGAIGADLILYGDVGQLGETLVVNLHVFDARNARAVGRDTLRVNDLGELPDEIDGSVARLLGAGPAAPRVAEEPATESVNVLPYAALGGAAVGGLILAGGVMGIVLGAGSWARYDESRAALDAFAAEHPSPEGASLDEAAALSRAAEEERTAYNQWGGLSLVGGSAAAAVGTLALVVGAGAAAWLFLAPVEE